MGMGSMRVLLATPPTREETESLSIQAFEPVLVEVSQATPRERGLKVVTCLARLPRALGSTDHPLTREGTESRSSR